VSAANSLTDYRLLGRSGLSVSPLALGTAGTFGMDGEVPRRMFDAYLAHGGNFVDTADVYGDGQAEERVGEFMRGKREKVVVGTKYSLGGKPGNPNSGGNSRLTMVRAVEASLKRLGTDYIDLYYLHVWDGTTQPDEVMRGLDDLVQSGKVVYVGISDTPAWQVSRMQTMADLRGWAPCVSLQIEYSLIQRTVEREMIPMARELDMGVTVWSPLGFGMLAGGYSRKDLELVGRNDIGDPGTRRRGMNLRGRLTEHIIDIAEAVAKVAGELGVSPAQAALAWVVSQPGVTSTLLGPRTWEQFEDNLGALKVKLEPGQLETLQSISEVPCDWPYELMNEGSVRAGLLVDTKARLPR